MTDFGKDLDVELDTDTLAQIQAKLLHITRQYHAGKALFPRRLLEDLSRQIDQRRDEIQVADFDDIPRTYSLKVPNWCADFANTYRINYRSIHDLCCPTPVCPELVLRSDHCPVSIGYTRSSPPAGASLDDVHAAFLAKRQLWRASSTCHALERHLATMPLSTRIHKIVCFALGPLGRLDYYHTTRALVQHAAVETIAHALAARHPGPIACYAQDPAYDAVDRDLLRRIGIVPLEDPKGFLEIDSHTLVFSVSPNVPVKQIVVDLPWPAAMLWNTVVPAEKDRKQWVKMIKNGDETWTSPFTTDPDSRRVRKMVMQYAHGLLVDPHEYLGDLSIYTK